MCNITDPHHIPAPGPVADPEPQTPTSDRRAITSPINGAKSQGPKTADGKKRSSANSLQHGLYSRDIVLITEKQQEYDALKATFLDTFTPANLEEHELVIDMVNARWRIRRAERHENGLLDLEIAEALHRAPSDEPIDLVKLEAQAVQKLAESRALDTLNRMALRLERSYQRSREALLKMQRKRLATPQPEPQPDPEPEPVRFDPDPPAPPPSPNPVWKRWLQVLFNVVIAVVLIQPVTALKPAPAASAKLYRR